MNSTMRYSRTVRGASLGCALGACLLATDALADWESTPDLRMELEANDNPRLGQRPRGLDEELDDHTATRMLMDARVRLRNIGRRGQVVVQPRVRLDAYSDAVDDDLERRDVYLNTRATYSWQRADAGISMNVARESIISAELGDTRPISPDDPIDTPIENDTGLLVQLDEFRKRVNVTPFAEISLSERSALLLEARLLDVSYTGPELRGRSDFTDTLLSLGVGRTIDDRTDAAARFIVSRFEADLTGNETDTVGLEGSFTRQLNELWSFNLTTGLQRSDFSFLDDDGEMVDNATTNYTMSISFGKRTELSTIDFGIHRLLDPNAVGFLVERNELRLRFTRQLSERLTAGFGFSAVQMAALDQEDVRDRDYLRADFDLEWAFTRQWSFAARYGAVDQKFSGERLDGTANMLSVGAVFRGLSRPAPP